MGKACGAPAAGAGRSTSRGSGRTGAFGLFTGAANGLLQEATREVRVARIAEPEPALTPELEALGQNVTGLFQQIVTATPNLSDELSSTAAGIQEPGRLADFIAGKILGALGIDHDLYPMWTGQVQR